MHTHGFTHHDIRPGNYCINNNRVILGYLQTDGRQKILLRPNLTDTKSLEHVEALQSWQLARRDDINSLGLSILQLIDPELSKVTGANFSAFLKEKYKFLKLEPIDECFESSIDD